MMFTPRVWYEKNLLFHTFHETVDFPAKYNTVDFEVGDIVKIEQHETTVYVKGTRRNVIVVNVGFQNMRALHEYSHLIPTWMKEDFNRFLNE